MLHINRLLGSKRLLVAAILYSCIISVLFFLPSGDFPKVGFSGIDKLVHATIYIILICLWQLYFYVKNEYQFKWKWALLIALACLLYGIIIEILQGLITNSRSADIFDVLANLTGSLLGILIFKKIKHIFNP